MRVLITGMGGQLGTRVAQTLESDPSVECVAGYDVIPPRGRLRAAEFHRLDPTDRAAVARVVDAVAPTAVAHLGVYEPAGRLQVGEAERVTKDGAVVLVDALASTPVERVVARSGIEVYGRADHPDEDTRPAPTTPFGEAVAEVERTITAAYGDATLLRFAPVAGPHFPSPLGRYLRLPLVPVDAFADPEFCVLHHHDAASAVVTALTSARAGAGAVNVVGPEPVRVRQAAGIGHRPAVPVVGAAWPVVTRTAEVIGVPVPPHLVELLRHGRVAAGDRAATLGMTARPCPTVVEEVFAWAPPAAPFRSATSA